MKTINRKTSIGTAALMAALAAVPSLSAADTTKSTAERTSQNASVAPAQHKPGQSADDIIGQDVRSRTGQDLGEVQDLVVDPKDGRIVYALVSTGGVLGIGEELHVIPFAAFTSGVPTRNALNVDLGSAARDSLPKVRGDQIASLGQEEKRNEIYRAFGRDWKKDMGASAGQQSRSNVPLMLVSKITGKEVRNNGQEVGEIEDVIVDFNQRRASVVLDPEDDYVGSDRKFALSLEQLTTTSADDDVLLTKLTRAEFEKAGPAPTDRDATQSIASSHYYPYVWNYTGIYPATGALAPGADRTPVSQIRRELRNDSSLGDAARTIEVRRQGNQVVIRGTVPSEDLKEKIEDRAETLAKGWDVKNELSVRAAAE